MGGVIVALALLASFGLDLSNIAHSGSVDLRNHITGVRLLEHGIDPYHYQWHAGEPSEYIDLRYNQNLPVTKTTVTPALLLVHLPFAPLPYRATQYLWLVTQWLMLLATAGLWLRACATSFQRWLVLLVITGFSYTAAWRWEAERGQAYLLLAFLFTCWQTTTLDPKRTNSFLAGSIAGFLIALRPPFLLLLPFLALHRRGQLLGAVTGLLLGIGLPMLLNPACWTEYASAMQTFSHLYRNGINPPHATLPYPPVIEGTSTELLGQLMPFHTGDFSFHGLLRRAGFEPFPEFPPLLAVAALFTVWLWWTRKQPASILLAGLAAWFFLADLFLPALRYSYHDIFILNAVLAGVVVLPRIPWALGPCLLALVAGWSAYIFSPPGPWWVDVPALLFTLGALLFLIPSIAATDNER